MSGLAVQQLSVRYRGVLAVSGVSFEIDRGSVLGLVGESGSGKSTVAGAVLGLTSYEGRIEWDGEELGGRAGSPSRRRLQLVFQDPRSSLDPRFSVEQCVTEALRSRQGARQRVRDLLELVALDPELASRSPDSLSGGQRQRVAIARALAAEPEVLVADEVTASLDVSVQAVVLNLLRRIQHELSLTMLFISHNLAVVRYMSNQLAVMYHGRIVEHGETATVVEDPQHPYTRTLLDAVPKLGRRLLEHAGEAESLAEAAEAVGGGGGCPFRTRCPIGPRFRNNTEICEQRDPALEASSRRHGAACHFAEAAPGAPHPAERTPTLAESAPYPAESAPHPAERAPYPAESEHDP